MFQWLCQKLSQLKLYTYSKNCPVLDSGVGRDVHIDRPVGSGYELDDRGPGLVTIDG